MERKKRADQKAYHFIYKTTCKVTDRHYYGMHSTDDVDDGYLGSGLWLWRSIKKHGKENHVREIVEFLSDRKSLCEREKEIVTKEHVDNPMCMNLCVGGGASIGHSVSTRQKISKRKIGQKLSDEHKQKLSKALKGRKLSKELIMKISNSNRGKHHIKHTEETKRKMSESHKGLSSGMKGKKHTKEACQKIAKARKGIKLSETTKQRLSDAHKGQVPWNKGKKLSEETKRKMSEARKRYYEMLK